MASRRRQGRRKAAPPSWAGEAPERRLQERAEAVLQAIRRAGYVYDVGPDTYVRRLVLDVLRQDARRTRP